ncbi:hypothetical protein BE221DRAFT_191557 [Ostreococcus tauri]|uniref:Translation initiation factor eIF2B subunit delta n=1 Tax=Ostreococcus tauri TaxID=70448 RepID=A0A1Y5IEG9_OSTTA|nr:hypothetical protein BE221DRAFT_191557 [Ostreococcus tauri]
MPGRATPTPSEAPTHGRGEGVGADFTRTVGFSVPSAIGHAHDAGRDHARSGVAKALSAYHAASTASNERESGRETERRSIEIEDGTRGGAAGTDDVEVGSRSPVMILPSTARGQGSAGRMMGTKGPREARVSGGEGRALATEFARKATTAAAETTVETNSGTTVAVKDVRGVDTEVARANEPVEKEVSVKEEKRSSARANEAPAEKKERKEKTGGPPRDIPEKKPPMTKADRRALQEAQRAAKAAKQADAGGAAKKPAADSNAGVGADAPATAVKGSEDKALTSTKKKAPAVVASSALKSGVSHLRSVNKDFVPNVSVHPAVERLAVNYARGITKGARERVSALLLVLRAVVESFKVPDDSTYAVSLTHTINQVVHTLDKARPMGVAMGNAVRSLKTHLARLSREEAQGISWEKCRQQTLMHIDYFIKEKLELAIASITDTGVAKIENGDTVVTHGASQVVREILLRAHANGVQFTVVVVDSRPSSEGAGILSDLCAQGIDCVFTALNGLSYIMEHATKVLIGAAACLSNGAVVSRIGASAVAHAAVERSIPVFVAAETCKFHERVQFDAFAFNELGATEDVIRVRGVDGVLASAGDVGSLSIINLAYDIVPAKCVESIICEVGEIVPSEVPCHILPH